MDIYSIHRDLYNQPLRLDARQQQHPKAVLQAFFDDHHLWELRQQLWNLVTAALTGTSSHFQEPEERHSLLHLYEEFEKLLEASWLLGKEQKPG